MREKMDVDEIAAIVSRASQLRSKINDCIEKASLRSKSDGLDPDDLDDETESLLNIRDALESLEEQLASLQVLQQQQKYERVVTLADIDHNRRVLLKKLKEYKGEDFEVIREASVFAGETVEHDDDLVLPPYPTRLPGSMILEDGNNSRLPFTQSKLAPNGVLGDAGYVIEKNMVDSEKQQIQDVERARPNGIKLVLGLVAKTVFTLISVVTVLRLAGFEPKIGKRNAQLRILNLFQKPIGEENEGSIQCPPGKVLVMENGERRCLVKERVEIPFEPVVATPDISYGHG